MDRSRFQAEHGPTWAAITQQPAFLAAMQMAYEGELNEIATLSHEQIQNYAVPILARLRGHLGHEQRLMELAVVEKDPLDLPPETYEEPSVDAAGEPEAGSNTYTPGPFAEFQQEQAIAPKPKPRRRRKRRKRKTKNAKSKSSPSNSRSVRPETGLSPV